MNRWGNRNNLLAGGFVIGCVFLAVWVSFQLADRSAFGDTTKFTVRFPLDQGALGLKRGSPVTLGGQPVGRVLEVHFARRQAAPGPDVPVGVDVKVEVRSDLAIYKNAPIYLSLPLLGSLSSINLTGAGTPESAAGSPIIQPGDVIAGRLAPPAFLAGAGFGEEQAAQLRQVIMSLEHSLSRAQQLVDSNAPVVEKAITDARDMVASLRRNIDAWTEQADRLVANAANASDRLDPILSSAQEAINEAKGLVADARSALTENRAAIDDVVAKVQSVATKLDHDSIGMVNDTLKSARDALHTLDDAVGDLASLLTEQTPSLQRTLANFRLMSDQLKLTAIEVRSQPWRLLHQPTTKEFESQVVYDAARSYAQAAGDLRNAAEALKAVTRGGESPGDARLAELTRSLNESYEKYHAAEKYFLDTLINQEKK